MKRRNLKEDQNMVIKKTIDIKNRVTRKKIITSDHHEDHSEHRTTHRKDDRYSDNSEYDNR